MRVIDRICALLARLISPALLSPHAVAPRLADSTPMPNAALRRLLDVIESCGVIGEPQVFAMIEEDLRARMAVPVQGDEK